MERYRDPNDSFKLIIVTAKLLTGFDAPILQAMYLDKPLRNHTLLQAITRANRTYSHNGLKKTHGLIVDYLGVFDDVAKSLEFDEDVMRKVVADLSELKDKLGPAIQQCLTYFPNIDRSQSGYEALMAAQECLPTNEVRDNFAADFSVLMRLWEALSPDPVLTPFENDYRWLTQVYESVQPPSGNGALIWHVLGAKTVELIHDNVHVLNVEDNIETLVLDEEVLGSILGTPNPDQKAREVEVKIMRRLRKHLNNPKFKALAQRLEDLRNRHESGQLNSLEFLKSLLELAKDVVQNEKDEPEETDEDRAKAALTDLFEQVKNENTPIIVERIVGEIDEVVRFVRFDGWQGTSAGERDVQRALRKTLLKYRLHTDLELFNKAYDYIKQYY